MVGLGFVQRLLIIPIILSYWDASAFGRYLVMSAALNYVGLIGRSFEAILGREILRLNKGRVPEMVKLYGGGIFVSLGLEVIVATTFIAIMFFFGSHFKSMSLDNADVFILAGSYFIGRALLAFPGAAYCAVLYCYGCYPKINWLGAATKVIVIIGPVTAVIMGCRTSVVVAVETLIGVVTTPISWTLFRRWGKANGVWKWDPDIAMAFKVFLKSLQNVVIQGVETIRGEGVRLVIAPFSGTSALAAFSTMRTGANVALQGLSTITAPLMPELMRFISERDQARVESAFSTVWLVVVGLMTPAVVVLQLAAPHLFPLWTRGHIVFDPTLFAIFSLSVLVFASAQPAMAVLQGNNVLRPQLALSALTGGTTVLGVFLSVPVFGIRGAAVSLLTAEVISATGYQIMARIWLRENGMVWPASASNSVIAAVIVSGLGMAGMILWPKIGLLFTALCLIAQFLCLMTYWRRLPELVRSRVITLIAGRLPGRLAVLSSKLLS